MLTRVCKAKDRDSGIELSSHLLGKLNCLQVHHIFPKSLLYKHGYSRSEVNAIANFTFLTQNTNLKVSNSKPADYFKAFELIHPGAIGSHWIPMDRELWKVENYRDFLAARRKLLSLAANDFLDSLLAGSVPESQVTPSILEREVVTIPSEFVTEAEEQVLQECNEWVQEQGLPQGESLYELVDTTTGRAIAVFDLAWPNGLQERYSQPVALLIDQGSYVESAANRAGYRYFTDLEIFKQYVQREILGMADESLPIARRIHSKMTTETCPICNTTVELFPRYPRYVCSDCCKKATDINGRKLRFYNVSMSGGYIAYYADSNDKEEYESHDCYIDTVKCRADEAYLGGIVIEAV